MGDGFLKKSFAAVTILVLDSKRVETTQVIEKYFIIYKIYTSTSAF